MKGSDPMNKKLTRWLAALLALSLVAAACGSDDPVEDAVDAGEEAVDEVEDAAEDVADEAEEATDDEDEGEEAMADGGDGVLTIGTIFPVTGDLAFLGPAEVQGAELAVADINAAGGVLGNDVVLEQGDSGDTTTDTANTRGRPPPRPAGSDAIMGAASSAVSKTVIDKITGAVHDPVLARPTRRRTSRPTTTTACTSVRPRPTCCRAACSGQPGASTTATSRCRHALPPGELRSSVSPMSFK